MLRELLFISLVVLMVTVGWHIGCGGDTSAPVDLFSEVVTGEFRVVMEIMGEEAEIILADRARAESEFGKDYEFAADIDIIKDDYIEVSAPIPNVYISINGEVVTTEDNGTFIIEGINLEVGDIVTVSDDGDFIYLQYTITEAEVSSSHLAIEDRFDYDSYLEKQCNHNEGITQLKLEAFGGNYSCLDNNGTSWGGGFRYSDCYMSLFYVPGYYSWMCWAEAMNVIHDHYGNIWCNGNQNCSLFVHSWNWNCQNWHRHYGYWTVGSGC